MSSVECNYNNHSFETNKNVKIKKTTILGNYKIQQKSIGKGSFSKIYLGQCRQTNILVAVKIIKKKNIRNEKHILREISIMKLIHHKNVILLKDVLVSNNKYYLILDYCPNGDLKKFMKNRIIDETKLLFYMKQIRDGLRELNKNNIIHRDLKPQNILVGENENLKISDFGFAKSYKPEQNLQQTMCGSPLYMAPEILQHKIYTDKADIWSVGVIMYELYYNRLPINGNNIVDLIENISNFEYKQNESKQISANGNDLLKNLLQTDPKKRFDFNDFLSHSWFYKTDKMNEIDEMDEIDEMEELLFSMDMDTNIKLNEEIKVKDDYFLHSEYISPSSHLPPHLPSYLPSQSKKTQKKTREIPIQHKSTNRTVEKSFVEDNYHDENFVIISSPSEVETYSILERNSYRSMESESNELCNSNEQNTIENTIENTHTKYVGMKRIFNSLRDSFSYIFGPKSI
jgi:serine/threonine protein kinase